MAILKFNGIGISAMAGAVPSHVIENLKYTEFFPEDQVKEAVDKVGVLERRFADAETVKKFNRIINAHKTEIIISSSKSLKDVT